MQLWMVTVVLVSTVVMAATGTGNIGGGSLQQLQSVAKECPTWFIPEGSGPNKTVCKCGSSEGNGIKCDSSTNQTLLAVGLCMTYDPSANSTIAGSCPFTNELQGLEQADGHYIKLPTDVQRLNNYMCSSLNRTGLLCSHCQPGTGPVVLSYVFRCLPCMEKPYGLIRYIVQAFLPMTVFLILVIVLHIHATSASLNMVVLSCQLFSWGAATYPNAWLSNSQYEGQYVGRAVIGLYGLWNLEFFRMLIPPFCISEGMRTIDIVALEYLLAVYPLTVIVLTFIAVELYARDYKLFVYMWKPFRGWFARLQRRWLPKYSIIHVFATILLLSYTKLLQVTGGLLASTKLCDPYGDEIGTGAYYNASIKYLHSEHLPLAVLAYIIIATVVAMPLLFLCLYPTRLFQRCMTRTSARWQHAMHTFAAAFNGCYKDGTKGTHDYRSFGGFYLLVRILFGLIWIAMGELTWLLLIISLSFFSTTIAILRPYKKNWFNYLDSVSLACGVMGAALHNYDFYVSELPRAVLWVLTSIPLLYLTTYVAFKTVLKARLLNRFGRRKWYRKLRHLMEQFTDATPLVASESVEASEYNLPDRLLSPGEYIRLSEGFSWAVGTGHTETARLNHQTGPTYGLV